MKVLGIVGPTAVGKTSLSVRLAKKYNGEIISCDSMQIYKGMDIGTAKVTKEEMDGVTHHLIDIIDPSEAFSCADYAKRAKELIADITKRGKTPIFCGGTGLYLDSVLEISTFGETVADEEYRHSLEDFANKNGALALHNMLNKIDPVSAEAIHYNNVKRVIRALEIYKCTGKPKSVTDRENKKAPSPYESKIFFLTCEDKELLYSRCQPVDYFDREERERILSEAQNRSETMIKNAEEKVVQMIDEHEITKQAVEQANQLVNDAAAKAMEIKTDCNQYADDILSDLSKRLDMLLRKVNDDKAYFDNK